MLLYSRQVTAPWNNIPELFLLVCDSLSTVRKGSIIFDVVILWEKRQMLLGRETMSDAEIASGYVQSEM